jgi:cell wall assembly regulator SMI1
MTSNSVERKIHSLWKRIERWFEANVPNIALALQAGATDEQIGAAERAMGVTLPEDVRASYRIHNGQRNDVQGAEYGFGILEAEDFLSLENMVEQWRIPTELLREGKFDGIIVDSSEEVKPEWWNSRWVPITFSGGNNYCIDLDPAPGGKVGQIIDVWFDAPERGVIAGSFMEWLEDFADRLEAGEYVTSEDYGGIVHINEL